MTSAIQKRVLVECNASTAFDIFVECLDRWWPVREHSVSAAAGKVPLAVHVDPQVGGVIYETTYEGNRAIWGQVQEIHHGSRFVTSWHPGHGATKATKMDVSFQNAPLGKCKVTLTHSGWKVWGSEAAKRREMYDGGWDYVLGKCYSEGVVGLLA